MLKVLSRFCLVSILMISLLFFKSLWIESAVAKETLFKPNSDDKLESKEINIANRGCCSHHGGVCGCTDDGSVLCCDQSQSLTCDCFDNFLGRGFKKLAIALNFN